DGVSHRIEPAGPGGAERLVAVRDHDEPVEHEARFERFELLRNPACPPPACGTPAASSPSPLTELPQWYLLAPPPVTSFFNRPEWHALRPVGSRYFIYSYRQNVALTSRTNSV